MCATVCLAVQGRCMAVEGGRIGASVRSLVLQCEVLPQLTVLTGGKLPVVHVEPAVHIETLCIPKRIWPVSWLWWV